MKIPVKCYTEIKEIKLETIDTFEQSGVERYITNEGGKQYIVEVLA